MKNTVLLLLLVAALTVGGQTDFRYVIKEGNKYGYTDNNGKKVIEARFEEARYFSLEGLALVKLNGKYGYIDRQGGTVIDFKFDYAESFNKGYAVVGVNGLRGMIDKSGKEIIPLTMKKVEWQYGNEILTFGSENQYGLFNAVLKKEIAPLKYESAGVFREKYCAVKLNGKWGFLDMKGKEVIPFKFDEVTFFSESRAAFMKNNKWGFVDARGKEVIPAEYDSVSFFTHGKAFVKKNGKWGMINIAGKTMIEMKYERICGPDLAELKYYPRARVVSNNKTFLLDVMTGKEYEITVDEIFITDVLLKQPVIGKKNKKFILLSESLNQLTEPVYDSIFFIPSSASEPFFIAAIKDGKYGILNNDGKPLTQFDYSGAEVLDYKDVWLIKEKKYLRANVEVSQMPAPDGTKKINELLFADISEVGVGDWVAFLSDSRRLPFTDIDFSTLLPDTLAMPEKLRPAFRSFFTESYEQMNFTSYLIGKKMQIDIPKNADKKNLEKLFDYPVTGISYEQADAFCKWRSAKMNEQFVSGEDGTSVYFRLPAPEEWEMIAGAGLAAGKNAADSINDKGCILYNYKADAECETVKQIKKYRGGGLVYKTDFWPNNIGFYNMFGNAAEMTSTPGVAKGGSHLDHASNCAKEKAQNYTGAQPWLGFRCVAFYSQTP